MKRGRIVMAAVVVALLVGSGAFAADWHKIGSATLIFKNPQIEIKAKKSVEPCSQIRLRVTNEMVSVESLKLYFADGTTQEVDFDGVIRPGVESDPIAVENGPKTLERVELAHKATMRGGAKRAQITVQGAT